MKFIDKLRFKLISVFEFISHPILSIKAYFTNKKREAQEGSAHDFKIVLTTRNAVLRYFKIGESNKLYQEPGNLFILPSYAKTNLEKEIIEQKIRIHSREEGEKQTQEQLHAFEIYKKCDRSSASYINSYEDSLFYKDRYVIPPQKDAFNLEMPEGQLANNLTN